MVPSAVWNIHEGNNQLVPSGEARGTEIWVVCIMFCGRDVRSASCGLKARLLAAQAFSGIRLVQAQKRVAYLFRWRGKADLQSHCRRKRWIMFVKALLLTCLQQHHQWAVRVSSCVTGVAEEQIVHQFYLKIQLPKACYCCACIHCFPLFWARYIVVWFMVLEHKLKHIVIMIFMNAISH